MRVAGYNATAALRAAEVEGTGSVNLYLYLYLYLYRQRLPASG